MKLKWFSKNTSRIWQKFYAILPRKVEDGSMVMFDTLERRRIARWTQQGNKYYWEYREVMCPLTRRRLARERAEAEQAAQMQDDFEAGYIHDDNGWDGGWDNGEVADPMPAQDLWPANEPIVIAGYAFDGGDGAENVPDVIQIPDAAPEAAIERA